MVNSRYCTGKSDEQSNLPYSNRVNIPSLLRVFSNTSTAYKYLFFLALMDILEKSHFELIVIDLQKLLLQMLVRAWYPHTYFKLSFGISDRIARQLDNLGLDIPIGSRVGAASLDRVAEQISEQSYSDNTLLAMVPFRLLTPFFSRELRGIKDTMKNLHIMRLAAERFETVRPLYRFTDDGKSIIMHHDWMLYFSDNAQLVRTFICWNWLTYMQRRNPSVPNLQVKLFPPVAREALTKQKEYYSWIVRHETVRCVYSGTVLSPDDISLDHFLPWSFVAHDQLWNLLPVSRSINSSKSDNLPSLEHYLAPFAALQYRSLLLYHHNPGKIPWRRIVEPYVTDLRLRPEDVLDREKLTKGLCSVIEPLHALAAAQGFPTGWAPT